VARQLGRPSVVGCAALAVDPAGHGAKLAGVALKEGDWLSIDGETGQIHLGRGTIVVERPEADLTEVAGWHEMTRKHGAA